MNLLRDITSAAALVGFVVSMAIYAWILFKWGM